MAERATRPPKPPVEVHFAGGEVVDASMKRKAQPKPRAQKQQLPTADDVERSIIEFVYANVDATRPEWWRSLPLTGEPPEMVKAWSEKGQQVWSQLVAVDLLVATGERRQRGHVCRLNAHARKAMDGTS
jgi:ATP/maltotriose-dependent transcriptional regulator MalT